MTILSYCGYCHEAATYFCSDENDDCDYDQSRRYQCKRCAMDNKFICPYCESNLVEEDELWYLKEDKMYVIHKDGKPFCQSGNGVFFKIYPDKKMAFKIAKAENTREANTEARYNKEYYDMPYTERYPLELKYAEKLAKETWKSWEVVEYNPSK